VEELRDRIERLAKASHDTNLSVSLLTQFEIVLELHIRECDRIRAELAALGCPKNLCKDWVPFASRC
jgi:hypothetical protein